MKSFRDRFSDTGRERLPVSRSNRAIIPATSSITNRASLKEMSFSSRAGTKTLGEIRPYFGSFHRLSASKEVTFPVSVRMTGWKYTVIQPFSSAVSM